MQHETSVAVPMTAPPNLSIKVPKSRDLPKKSKPWSNVQLPVDILLLTVEECEFLACYGYMRNSFRSYHDDFGSVYIGNMGEDEVEPLKIALMRCLKGSSGPCGSQTIVKNAVVRLRPKVVYSVGCCIGLNQENTEIGDVVISSNLTTEDFRTPVGRKIANLIRSAADGWEPPLESPQARDVHVHCDGEILCGVNVHQDTVKRHQQLYPRAVAMEMEGKGIFVASHDLKIEWVIVKGVSDLADGNRISDESWRYFACVMAASVVSHMLSDSIVFKQWPHYHDPSSGSENIPTVEYPVGQQSATVTKDTVCTFLSEKQPCLDEEKNVSRTDWEDGPSSRQSDRKRRSQSGSTPESGSRKRSVGSGSTFDVTDTFLRILVEFTGRDVSDEKKDYLYNILGTAGGQYVKSHNLTPELERVGAYFQHLEDQYNLNLVSIGEGSLEIIVHCPTLESLEHLWSDYLSGHLSEVAERYLVTDEIKRKLDLDTVRLKTTIAKKNYLMCRKALVEMSEESAAESLKSVCKPRLKRSVSETKKDAVASSKESNPRRSRSFSEFTFSQEPSHVSGKTSNEEFLFEKQSRADTPDEAGAPHLGHRSLIPEEKKTFRKEEDGSSCSDAKTLQTVSKQDTPVSTSETGTDTITLQLKITPEDLNEEQQEIFDDVIQQTVCSMEPDDLSTDEGVGSLTKYLKESRHSLTLKTFTSDGLTIIVQCPVESLESLLVDCHSGHLNKVAERCLLTDKIRTILNMDTVRLKTTIEEEPSNVGMLKAAHPQTEPGQDVSTRWAETGGVESNAGFPSQRPEQDQGAGARWTEPGQGAHGSHTAAQLIKREPDHRTNTSWTNSSSEILLKTERRCPIAQLLLKNNARPSCRKPFSRTPLHLACRYGQESVVRLLLEHGANVNAIDRFQRAPLQKAEGHSHQSIAQLLLKNNAKPSCRQPGKMKETSCTVRAERAKSSRTALHKASISGQFETVKILLDSGEDVDQRDQFSLTPLHLACWYGQESVVRLLLEHGANVNAIDRFQRAPLQKAERHSHQSIAQLLLKNNARPSCRQPLNLKRLCQKSFLQVDTRSGLNLLQAAVFAGEYGIVLKALCVLPHFVKEMNSKIGYDAQLFPGKSAVDIMSILDKKTPGHSKIVKFCEDNSEKYKTLTELHNCTDYGDEEMAVELVLNDGVDADIPALCNRTPLLWASLSSSSTMIKTLIDLGADVNAQRTDDKNAPLKLAAGWNNYMAARLLLEHGADINLQDKNGVSALYAAVCGSHENLVELLLENNADLSIQDSEGDSLLHLSVSRGLFQATQLLIQAGCNVNLRNKRGRTPLYIAVKNKHEETVKLLLECNADVGMEYKQDPEERIYLVRGKHRGKPSWHYVLVDRHLFGLFLKQTGSFDVADFGDVLKSGLGKNPPENTIDNILRTRVDILQESPGETLLHVASRENSVNMIHLLVKHGAWDVNVHDADGFTPLHEAVIRGNMQAVKKLIDLKADVNQAGAIVDLAHMNEEIEIEEYLKSVIVPTEKTAENQDGEDIAQANPDADVLESKRSRLIGNRIQREGRQFLDAV